MTFNSIFKNNLIIIFALLPLLVFSQNDSSLPFEPQKLIKPSYLKAGDTIAIVAPSGVIKETEPIEKAKLLAESWGLHVLVGKNVFVTNFHFSGTDEQRREDFQNALDNKSVKAIWCARGGYGSVRIIDALDFSNFKAVPKWIVGYSDITVLHNHLHNLGYETLHAMMPINMKTEEIELTNTISTFKNALFGEKVTYKIDTSPLNTKGTFKGQLVGGNLSILQSVLGSSTTINTTGKILFLEEVSEPLYKIDRMLYSLKRSGYFNNIAGLIIGDFSDIKENLITPYGKTLEEIIIEATKEYSFPIIFNVAAGHKVENNALFLGREVEIKVCKEKTTIRFSE
ncbi:LD-carboxypeptidase [Lutibacter sp.]|uniref:S66 peptidase family protein n=1 Tax=Lutibacter sp. TaxID=1925666 RepID=UPI00273704AE|nr:LD-carboxypeptidase [Lutibacter sp.]MDP3314136.1 LD-carboxypeptidase [Lutibacter sp.]